MGGTSDEEQEEPLVGILAVASELFRLLPSVLARGRELSLELQDPQVQWYVENANQCLLRWLILCENGINPCPSVAAHVLDSSLPSESWSGPGS